MTIKHALLAALFFCGHATHAAVKDSVVFLRDTLQLADSRYAKLPANQQQLLVKVQDQPNRYIANQLGSFVGNVNSIRIADPLDDGITKILVIGNSFSDDGLESYFHDLAKQKGNAVVIGNLFRGGAALDFHLKNATTDNKIYSYRKTTIDNIKTNTDRTSILQALKDENWDYICFQQASATSGDLASVQASLPALFTYVKENYPYQTVKYLYHQTWAYAQNAVTANFQRYNKDQQLMYNQIIDVSKAIKDIIPLYKMIPSGTAIQNGRSSYLGDNFNREAYHLDLLIGRFTAACAWYETIFGGVKENPFKPYAVNEHQASIAKEAAFQAVKNPFAVTPLVQYQQQPTFQHKVGRVNVNFGLDLVMAGWNSFLYEKAGRKMHALQDENNVTSDINIEVVQNFEKRDMKGPDKTSIGDWKLPKEVSKSHFRVNVSDTTAGKSFVVISNLQANQSYNLEIFSSTRAKIDGINHFFIKGKRTERVKQQASHNVSESIKISRIQADQQGRIEIGFDLPSKVKPYVGYINALSIQPIYINYIDDY